VAERTPDTRHRARTRNVTGFVAIAAIVLAIPLGRYAPYASHALPETSFARACHALPGGALARALGTPVSASEVALLKVRAEVENLFPAVSRTACEYAWTPACRRAARPRSLIVIVATLPNASQALYRYSYTHEILHQDSLAANDFNDLHLAGYRGYELMIGTEVLVRVLDGRYVIDMQYHLCGMLAGYAAQAAVQPIAGDLRLPILATNVAPSAADTALRAL
jgi:hypothetical protein